MGLKESIEKNFTVWFIGIVIGAFLAGIGAYESIIRMTGQTVATRDEIAGSAK